MENVKIHYLGERVHTLETTNIVDAMYHLGAKYGTVLYNKAIQTGAITLIEEANTFKVNADEVEKLKIELNY